MNKAVVMLLVLAMSCMVACSKTEPAAKAPGSEVEAMTVDYKQICEHLIPLAPEARKASFAQTCIASYQSVLPACRNAAAVNDCFINLKSWDGRLACMDSCVRNPPLGK